MANRLTYRDENGKAWAKLKTSDSSEEAMNFGKTSIERLAAYEDLGTVEELAALKERTHAVVAPVVHGEWLNFTGDFSTAECNQCGELYEVSPDEKPCEDFFSAFKKFYKFCPNCGAKIDGGEVEK